MTIKVNRQKLAEGYNTTSDWIADHFSKKYSSSEKFATIEEKMVDMKSRVGFDKLEGIHKSAKSGCGSHESYADDCADCSNDLSDIGRLKKHIIEIIKDPGVSNTISNIMSKCEKNKGVSHILNKVKNKPLLSQYITSMIPKYQAPSESCAETLEYIPLEEAHSLGDIEENKPEYLNYGFDS